MSSKFTNKDLQAIHSTAELEVSARLSRLDAASNDIKALEQALSRAGISIKYMYCYAEKNRRDSAEIETWQYIVWNPIENRLFHEVHVLEYSFDGCPNNQITESRPLIETKAHVRLKTATELPFFYKQLIDELKKVQDVEIVKDYSPNLLIPF